MSRMKGEYAPASTIIGCDGPVRDAEARGGQMLDPILVSIPQCGDKYSDAVSAWYRQNPAELIPNLFQPSKITEENCQCNNCFSIGTTKSSFYSTMSVICHFSKLAKYLNASPSNPKILVLKWTCHLRYVDWWWYIAWYLTVTFPDDEPNILPLWVHSVYRAGVHIAYTSGLLFAIYGNIIFDASLFDRIVYTPGWRPTPPRLRERWAEETTGEVQEHQPQQVG